VCLGAEELDAFGNLGHRARTGRDLIFHFDISREGPFLFAHELEDLPQRSLALTPRQVATLGRAVLHVQASDAVVILFQHWKRGESHGKMKDGPLVPSRFDVGRWRLDLNNAPCGALE
jgi:hypothetical protein